MQIVIIMDGLKLFILFKICIAITILEWSPKLRPFRNNPIESLCITNNLMQAFILLRDSY